MSELDRIQSVIDSGFDIISNNVKFGKLGFDTSVYFIAIDFQSEKECKIITFENFADAFKNLEVLIEFNKEN